MSTPDHIPIPQQFRDTHYHQWELQEILGMAEEAFWTAYGRGQIPAGVPLLKITTQPLLVWPKADIHAWIEADFPANAELADRTRRVLESLVAAVEAEGHDLGEHIRAIVEQN